MTVSPLPPAAPPLADDRYRADREPCADSAPNGPVITSANSSHLNTTGYQFFAVSSA